jgi:hypothetical protein
MNEEFEQASPTLSKAEDGCPNANTILTNRITLVFHITRGRGAKLNKKAFVIFCPPYSAD